MFSLALRRRDRWEQEVEDEIKLHLALRAEQLVAQGQTLDDAYAEAVRRFGPLAEARTQLTAAARHRENRLGRTEMMSDLKHDLTFALRTLQRERTWTAVTIATFALGIGATTAVFSVVSSLLLHPLPYPDAGRVVLVDRMTSQLNRTGVSVSITVSGPLAKLWRTSAHSFTDLEPYWTSTVELTERDGTSELSAGRILPSFPRFAGVRPILGRGLSDADELDGRSIMLGEGIWRARYGASASVIGSRLTIDDSVYTVVGVMPATLRLPDNAGRAVDVWQPIDLSGHESNKLVGRLREGVSPEVAARELDSLTRRSGLEATATGGAKFSARAQRPDMVVRFRDSLLLLTGAVVLVLLIACTNVAHLLLARSAARHREMAIRAALGAGRGRLLRQLLTESLVISLVGAALGVLLGWAGLRAIVSTAPSALSELAAAHVDLTTLLVAVAVTVLSALVFGIVGALSVAPQATHDALKTGAPSASHSRRHDRVRSLLVVSEMALSATLLVGASLLVRSIWHMQHTDLGFDPHGLYAVVLKFPKSEAADTVGRATRESQIESRLRQLPAVQSAAVTSSPPGWFSFRIGALEVQGEAPAPLGTTSFINSNTVEPSYFHTMGIRFVEGRTFEDTSAHSTEVVVNESFARKHWPRGDAVGHRVRVAFNGKGEWDTIVGVTNDVASSGPMSDAKSAILFSPAATKNQAAVMVRANAAPKLLASIRSVVASVDPRVRVEIQGAEQAAAASIAEPRFVMVLLAIFTTLALSLAAIGLYGVMAYAVARRTREIGIRVALGAPQGRIARLVIVRGISLAVAGVVVGLTASLWGSKLIASSLFGVTRSDPASFAAGAAILIATAVLACIVPTRRALGVDPVTAIRAE